MKTMVRMTVDDTITVYGLDFIDCLVELEREGVVPDDSLPHSCTFVTVPLTDDAYKYYLEAANVEEEHHQAE